MEVHHPHHLTHKKKWSEYILEFVMLFAAVTLGFFAENIREHQIIENHKVQNLIAMIDDSITVLITEFLRAMVLDSYSIATRRNCVVAGIV